MGSPFPGASKMRRTGALLPVSALRLAAARFRTPAEFPKACSVTEVRATGCALVLLSLVALTACSTARLLDEDLASGADLSAAHSVDLNVRSPIIELSLPHSTACISNLGTYCKPNP